MDSWTVGLWLRGQQQRGEASVQRSHPTFQRPLQCLLAFLSFLHRHVAGCANVARTGANGGKQAADREADEPQLHS